jgi:hypothetical protein
MVSVRLVDGMDHPLYPDKLLSKATPNAFFCAVDAVSTSETYQDTIASICTNRYGNGKHNGGSEGKGTGTQISAQSVETGETTANTSASDSHCSSSLKDIQQTRKANTGRNAHCQFVLFDVKPYFIFLYILSRFSVSLRRH